MRAISLLLLACGLFGILACARRTTLPPSTTGEGAAAVLAAAGIWSYRAQNAEGKTVAEGTLTLNRDEASLLSGTWHINPVGETLDIGPQIGDGRLEGYVDQGGTVHINMNPDYADNNVTLAGTVQGDRFEGTWSYATIAGVRSSGPFEASPRD